MPRRRRADRPGARLARSYLVVRAEQGADRQPTEIGPKLRGTVLLPRLAAIQLNSPEAHAQYRLAILARLATGGATWFTLARNATAPDGTGCVDRALEIRRGGKRIPVPLLYTGTAPRLVNDTTMRARLSDHCRPGDAYLVDLRTGRPVRERQ